MQHEITVAWGRYSSEVNSTMRYSKVHLAQECDHPGDLLLCGVTIPYRDELTDILWGEDDEDFMGLQPCRRCFREG
jgi:hypothetical protein